MFRWFSLLSTLVLTATLLAAPTAKKSPVKDTYHGVEVVEEYRWLEDAKNADVKAWSDEQNRHARETLAKLPGVEKINGRLKEILGAKQVNHGSLEIRGGQVFALKRQPPKEQPFLVVMPALDQPEKARVLLDPMALDVKGTTSIDWYVPSPDGKLVAVSLSKAGSEAGDLHLFEVATGKATDVVIPRVQNGTAGGSVGWSPDGKGFYYTRYPRGDEKPEADRDFYQRLYYHELGTATGKDRYELGKELPRIAEIKVQVHNATGTRKMTARRLQAATASKAPILLRTSDTAGHGLDTSLSERIDEESVVFAFLMAQLGVKVE